MSGRSTPNILCPELSKYEFYSSNSNCQGAKSVVSTYINTRSGKYVVIKTVIKAEQEDYYDEVNVLKSLIGVPGMCQYIEHFEDDDILYIVMEKINAVELYDFIISEDLPPSHRHVIYKILLNLIANLHDNGIIHRDIKPSNIMISKNTLEKKTTYQLWLIDFGVSIFYDNRINCTNSGTWQYLSPEIFNKLDPSYADDVWATAVTIYAMEHMSMPFYSGSSDPNKLTLRYANNVRNLNYIKRLSNNSNLNKLIYSLLTSASDRLTASEALNHPYFNKRHFGPKLITRPRKKHKNLLLS